MLFERMVKRNDILLLFISELSSAQLRIDGCESEWVRAMPWCQYPPLPFSHFCLSHFRSVSHFVRIMRTWKINYRRKQSWHMELGMLCHIDYKTKNGEIQISAFRVCLVHISFRSFAIYTCPGFAELHLLHMKHRLVDWRESTKRQTLMTMNDGTQ